MDRIKITVAVLFAVLSFFIGLNIASENTEQGTQSTALPAYNTEVNPSENVSISSLRDLNNAFINIAERTNPTVVTITTTQTVRMRQQNPLALFFNDPRFREEREFQRDGLGSGVIVSADGYIITNNHVIDGADEIRVILFGGDELDAELVGADPASDIAVLRVDSDDLSAISLGNSDDIRVGEMVLAIGSPLDQQFAHTVSKGIISASGRSALGLNVYESYIQTDAAINPGNSGGALVNMDGELIGINTAIASRSGGNQGLGFAIPVNMVRSVMEALITDGRVTRGYLGIDSGGEVDETMSRALGLERARGFVLGTVVPDSPADIAGLMTGDVVLSLNGNPITSYTDFRMEIGNSSPGSEITLGILRNGERMSIEVELGERPLAGVAESVTPNDMEGIREALGFEVDELTNSIRGQLNLDTSVQGVVVSDISQSSRAYRQGLRRGDVISQVASQQVNTPNEFYGTIRSLIQEGTDATLLRVNRQGRNIFIAIEL